MINKSSKIFKNSLVNVDRAAYCPALAGQSRILNLCPVEHFDPVEFSLTSFLFDIL